MAKCEAHCWAIKIQTDFSDDDEDTLYESAIKITTDNDALPTESLFYFKDGSVLQWGAGFLNWIGHVKARKYGYYNDSII